MEQSSATGWALGGKRMNRSESLKRLRSEPLWDFVIIGGGATGLGIAVDAANRGMQTLLLEAHDFCKGTSSRSTKLVHGGVRYLEQGDIPLVLEALRERGLLHRNAPHLVHHLSFIVPRYQWWEGPFFGLGMKLYDALAGKLNLSPSRILSREETLEKIPNVEPEKLLGGVEYFDGQFDDARLGLTLTRTAENHGACCLNYLRVEGLHKARGMVEGVRAVDVETGEPFQIRARAVINATGIFSDQVRWMDDADAPAAVQPSQGVHLVFDRSFLPGSSAIMVPHTDDGRVLFVIPWHHRVLVGTTDTPMDKPAMEPVALEEEIGFILRNAARYLARDPSESDLLSIFAGQRPLVRPPGKGGAPTKSISRNHEIFVSASGLITVAGGKWTTYRQMAEDTLRHAFSVAGLDEPPCRTRELPLHGWMEVGEQDANDVLLAYGSDLSELRKLEQENPELAEMLHPDLPYPKSVVLWAVREEMARTLEDVLARRTRSLLLDARASVACSRTVAEMLAAELSRDSAWIDGQVAAFKQLAAQYLPS